MVIWVVLLFFGESLDFFLKGWSLVLSCLRITIGLDIKTFLIEYFKDLRVLFIVLLIKILE